MNDKCYNIWYASTPKSRQALLIDFLENQRKFSFRRALYHSIGRDATVHGYIPCYNEKQLQKTQHKLESLHFKIIEIREDIPSIPRL